MTVEPLYESWLCGLAVNKAMPRSVLERFLTLDPLPDCLDFFGNATLSAAAVELLCAHPDPKVRRKIIENPDAPADLLLPLARDPDPQVRAIFTFFAAEYRRPLPPAVIEALAADESPRVRGFLCEHPDLPDALATACTRDPDPHVRRAALSRHGWELLSDLDRDTLRSDPDPKVRARVADITAVELPLPAGAAEFAAETDQGRLRRAAATAVLDDESAALLADHGDVSIRRAAAGNPSLPPRLVDRLAEDPDGTVRLAISLRPELTEPQRQAIDYAIEPGRYPIVGWVEAGYGDADLMRRCARSCHVLIRRSVAAARDLPPDVADLLARDEDFFVRLMLAECCDSASELHVLEIFASWHGKFAFFLPFRPTFPRHGLAALAQDPEPRRRWASLRDPAMTSALVGALASDPDDTVRSAAARDPRLPQNRLLELLYTQGSATSAAANPSLSIEQAHRLLDVALAE